MLRLLIHLALSLVLLVGPLACCCTVAAPRDEASTQAPACCCCQDEPTQHAPQRKTECSCNQKQPYLGGATAVATFDVVATLDLLTPPAYADEVTPLLHRGQFANVVPWFRTSQDLLRALQTLRL